MKGLLIKHVTGRLLRQTEPTLLQFIFLLLCRGASQVSISAILYQSPPFLLTNTFCVGG